ncbi:hypothetical protein CBP76_02920 [Companilactobacillus nuruki]|uniref:Uncharacterized protein n=1 Tax=Companilactobacillus nuruki TaxID=1993540 RepID=A0A2N7AWG8_9LACO|nr:hypothetical protein CBP76_02920 [Companilactobacillus nuruki]
MKNFWTVQHIFLGILMDAFFICQITYNINLQRERRLFQVKKMLLVIEVEVNPLVGFLQLKGFTSKSGY